MAAKQQILIIEPNQRKGHKIKISAIFQDSSVVQVFTFLSRFCPLLFNVMLSAGLQDLESAGSLKDPPPIDSDW